MCKLLDNLRFECIVCVLFRYNITFMIITYFLPMGSMCFTYSRYDVITERDPLPVLSWAHLIFIG